jgi:peroxiredoxin
MRTLRTTLTLTTLTLATLTLAAASIAAHAQTASTPDLGAHAPDFTLSTPEGQSVRLSSLEKSGPVVLVLLRGYPGYQCPFCQRQVHDFVQNADKFTSAHTQVLLVYPGPPAELDARAKEFLTRQEGALPANIHLVIDPNYTMTTQYGLRWDAPQETSYASTFILDRQGVVHFRKISKGHGDRTTAADLLPELTKLQ